MGRKQKVRQRAREPKRPNPGRGGPNPPPVNAKTRRSIVDEKILRDAFKTLDAKQSGKIIVNEFLERLRGDEKLTEALQKGTFDFVTADMLDAVFDRIEDEKTSWATESEFLSLFKVSARDMEKRAGKTTENEDGADGTAATAVVEEASEAAPAKEEEIIAETAAAETQTAEAVEEPEEVVEEVREKSEAPAKPPSPVNTDPVVDKAYLKRVFNLIDYDGNGMVTLVEFLSALHANPEIGALLDEGTSAGGDVSEAVGRVFSRMDADQNKAVTFAEFVEYFTVKQAQNADHALNKLSREEKRALIENANKNKVRSMNALRKGIRFVSKKALDAGLRKSKKETRQENISKIADQDLLITKAYLRDVFKLIDYEKNERIVVQEFLEELEENDSIALALDVGSNSSDDPVASDTKKKIAIIFQAMTVDAKIVVNFKKFVNYFIRITADSFMENSPLSRTSKVREKRNAQENAQIDALVGQLLELENLSQPPPRHAEVEPKLRSQRPPMNEDELDELVYGDETDTAEDLDRVVHILRRELQAMQIENQSQKKVNNMLTLKLNVLTHMYAVQSAEFQALIDSTR
jgi:Ca2+-binding EF-hand superfamily protein